MDKTDSSYSGFRSGSITIELEQIEKRGKDLTIFFDNVRSYLKVGISDAKIIELMRDSVNIAMFIAMEISDREAIE